MTIIPLDFKITRNAANHKKVYTHSITNKVLTKPALPRNWQTTDEFKNITPQMAPSYAIRCDDDTIVLDCDDKETTALITEVLEAHQFLSDSKDTPFIVQSDKGERHFYFKPTDYYRKSAIYKTSRLRVKNIDILHGRALVFAACPGNTTKTVVQGDLPHLTQIPDTVVDTLVELFHRELVEPDEDFKPVASYLAPKIEQALALYARKPDYTTYLLPLFQMITPSKWKHQLAPSYHPDLIPDGEGTEYVQAVFTKLGQDPSVSIGLFSELLTLITQKLWSVPWDDARLKEFIDYIPRQVFSATKKPVFIYDEKAVAKPLVSINGNEYMPLYRSVDDDYILSKPSGAVEIIKGLSNFKKAVASQNYEMLVNNSKISLDTAIGLKKLTEVLKTVHIRNEPYYNTGEYEDDGSLYYNIYRPTKFLGIIRSEYKQDIAYPGPEAHPTITRIIRNIMWDNLVAEQAPSTQQALNTQAYQFSMYDKFIQFLAHKLKTLDYSPIVFQMMGNRGIGKSLLMSVLHQLTQGVVEVSFSKSNNQFNEEQENALFLNEDEGVITSKLVNQIKKMSGKAQVLIEGKGKTPKLIRNVATYICTTNKTTPLAEVIDDRRFVTLSGFKAERLVIPDVQIKIALELEAFALLLRDTKLINRQLYIDANQWHDSIHYTNFSEKQDSLEDMPLKIADMAYNIASLSGTEIHKTLELVLGEGYHYYLGRQKQLLALPLAKMPKLVDKLTGKPLTHSITREQLKAVGLDNLCRLDRNSATNRYRTTYYKLELPMTYDQLDEWQQAYNYGTDLEIDGIEEE